MISSELCWDLGDRPIDSEDDDIFSLSQHTAYISRRSSVTTKLTAYVAANIKRSVSVLSVLKSMVGICLSVGVMGCSAYYFKQHGELCLVALAWRAGASWRAVCV
jgi:hypothetical protein